MADDERIYTIIGVDYQRIRYGDEKRFGEDWHTEVTGNPARRCHDCHAAPGAYHVPGCDMEECPRCGGQSIGCNCQDEELPYLRAEVERLRAREAAAMEIVRAVAAHGDDVFIGAYDQYGAREDDVCAYCERSLWEDNDSQHPSHALDCPVTQARALLAEKEAE